MNWGVQGRFWPRHGDWYFTPLDTAIEPDAEFLSPFAESSVSVIATYCYEELRMSQIAVVKLLLAQKAVLIQSKQEIHPRPSTRHVLRCL